ncbi:MAG: hypothetical protein EXR21_09350 [Flavobacteriaceae bacterium]|nr:hypothetical protein [Flavobacteriaceae bacterium]
MKYIFMIWLMTAVCIVATAQNEQDVLRYNGSMFGSSARNTGLAGAMGAVGHDISSVWMNPGGLAVNRNNVFSISASGTSFNSATNFANQVGKDSKFKMNIPSIGLVFTSVKYKDRKPVEEGWMNVNFGITLNQTSNYNERFNFSGTTGRSSFMDFAAQTANGYTDTELEDPTAIDVGSLGWQSFLIDQPTNGVSNYKGMYHFVGDSMPRFTQSGIVNRWGSSRELGLALAGCFSKKIYVGGSIGIPFIRFGYTNNYSERDSGNSVTDFKSLEFQQTNNTSGYGFNAKLGIIYRLTQAFRVGLALHSPTFLSLKDNYTNSLTANYDRLFGANGQLGYEKYEFLDKAGEFSYNINSPGKAIFSFAYVEDKKGLFSIDVERVANAKASISALDDPFAEINSNVKQLFKSSTNVRAGGELFDKSTFYRCGYSFYGSPYASKTLYKPAPSIRQSLTLGLGFYNKRHTLDIGYAYTWGKDFYSPYTLETGNYETAINKMNNQSVVVSYITKF